MDVEIEFVLQANCQLPKLIGFVLRENHSICIT